MTSVSQGKASYAWLNWSKRIPQVNQGDLKMVTEWSSLRFIIRNPYLPPGADQTAPSDLDNDPRTAASKGCNRLTRADELFGGFIMSDNPFVGSWTYRSLLNDTDLNTAFNDLEFVAARSSSKKRRCTPQGDDRRTRLVARPQGRA